MDGQPLQSKKKSEMVGEQDDLEIQTQTVPRPLEERVGHEGEEETTRIQILDKALAIKTVPYVKQSIKMNEPAYIQSPIAGGFMNNLQNSDRKSFLLVETERAETKPQQANQGG